jgi:ABC-type amino acid transport substrate-binding protein
MRSQSLGVFALGALGALLSLAIRADTHPFGRVLAAGELRVCVWPGYYGISHRNPNTQQLGGLDIDMARALASDLGVKLRFVDSSFSTLIDDVTRDRCDIAMFGIGITPARAERLAFSRPYLVSDVFAITTRSNRRVREWSDIDKPGVVVAVLKGTLHEQVMKERLKAATLLVVDSPRARELEVESGRADVFMTDYPYSRRMLDNVEWARLVSPPAPYHLTRYAYAVGPGQARWQARVDHFVAAIQVDGRLLESARRHKLDAALAPP